MTGSRLLFRCAVFLASFLLFLVEPMAAKQLLPVFGGSAAVWITCLVFFQTALLCAYLYAHGLARRPRWGLHLCLLVIAATSAILWSLRRLDWSGTIQHPFLAIFAALGISVGLPFLALGATSPLVQVWLSRLENGGIPYGLYALSNLASLLALGLYPVIFEPYLTLRSQRLLWAFGFAVFACISAILTWKTRSAISNSALSLADPETAALSAPIHHKVLWLLLPMCASFQLTAVTSHLTENIAPIPLLWILPLAVYLITLILAFQFPRLMPRWILTRLLVVMLASLGYMLSKPEGSLPLRIAIFFFLVELFLACLFCHAEAYALRPT